MKEKLRTRVKEQAEQEVTRKQELEAQAKVHNAALDDCSNDTERS